MKTKNTLLVLASSLVMGACNFDPTITEANSENTLPNQNDTVRITGVFTQGKSYSSGRSKYFDAVNKNGKKYFICYDVDDVAYKLIETDARIAAFTERGDTVVIQNGKFFKNLTQERLQSEFVKSK